MRKHYDLDYGRNRFIVMTLLAIHPGASYHIESLEAPRYAHYFDRLVRPEALDTLDLAKFDAVLIPCRTPAHRMIPHRARLRAYLEAGGLVIATGESHSEQWLPGINFHPQPTNYWWWLDKKADLGIQITRPDHCLFRYLDRSALTWHLHGWFTPPKGTEILATNSQGGAILVLDHVTTPGTMILTTLDPFYHHGSHFMPATTRFLDGFLHWIDENMIGRR